MSCLFGDLGGENYSPEDFRATVHYLAAGYKRVKLTSAAQTGTYLVPAEVNGHKTRLLLDTGALTTVHLRRSVAEGVGLNTELVPNQFVGGVSGGKLPVFTATPRTLRIGSLAIPPAPLVVSDLELWALGREFDKAGGCGGIIGSSLLNYYSAVIDYGGSQLFLIDPLVRERWLQGEWKAVAVAGGATDPGRRAVAGTSLRVDKHALYLTRGGVTTAYGLTLYPNERPKQFLLTALDGKTVSGIYRQHTAGTVQLVLPPADKPAVKLTFDATDDTPWTVLTFTRTPAGKP